MPPSTEIALVGALIESFTVTERPATGVDVAEQDVADRRARVAADVADGDGRADRACADADADRVDLDRPDRRRRHEDAAAGLMDRRAVVDVRVLRAGVVEHDDLRADRDEAAGACERETGDVLVHRRLDGDVARAAACRR